jgi:hypothetical protein
MQFIAQPSTRTSALSNITTVMNMGTAPLIPLTYSGVFPAQYVQSWVIRASSSLITFTFASFSFPASLCSARITVYDSYDTSGNVIFTGCLQSQQPQYWFYSKTGKALVQVVGGSSDTTMNFELDYYFDSNMYNCGSFVQPLTLTGSSMVVVDGTLTTNEMRRSQQCTWLISSSSGNSVTLIFDWTLLKFGSSVLVYDGSSSSSKLLWNGVGSTKVTPPPIISTGSTLYITYQSDSIQSSGYLGFRGQYQTNAYGSPGQGRGYAIMSMSSVLDIVPPGNSLQYTPNVTYTWYIQPTTVVGKLTFIVPYLNLTSQESLTLYDGNSTSSRVLASFKASNFTNVWYKTTNPYAVLKFVSKRKIQRTGGFRLSYFGDGSNYHCGFTTNPVTVDAPSLTITDGSYSTDSVYDNQDCQWNLTPQNSQSVFLFFTRFSLNSAASVTVYRGTVASGDSYVTISNNYAVPAPIILSGSTMGVNYVSGATASGTGFSASYFGLSSSYSSTGDGLVWIQCSSMLDLGAYRSSSLPMTNMTYIVKPTVNSGDLYFSLINVSVLDATSRVDIYDGTSLTSTLLASYTKDTMTTDFQWLKATSATALVHFVSAAESTSTVEPANFQLAFYSDGSNYHCGFHINPGLHHSASMVFTDGSSSSETMYPNQYCEWLIQPNITAASTLSSDHTVVLEFISTDLLGGELHVYDGTSTADMEVWSCYGCSTVPFPILSTAGHLFVTFQTYSSSTMGNGFTAVYWTTVDNEWQVPDQGFVLGVPLGYTFDTANTTLNSTELWSLDVSETPATLRMAPTLTTTASTLSVADGRKGLGTDIFDYRSNSFPSICGVLVSSQSGISGTIIDKNGTQSQRAQQYFGSYLISQSAASSTSVLAGALHEEHEPNLFYQPASLCRYAINDGSTFAVDFTISRGFISKNTILRIYGGVFNNDHLLYDSSTTVENVTSVTAPCGRALIILSYDSSTEAAPAFNLTYNQDPNDGDKGVYACAAYSKYCSISTLIAVFTVLLFAEQSLLPVVKKANPLIPVYYAAGGLGFLIIVCCISAYIYRHYGHRDIDCNCKRSLFVLTFVLFVA